MTIAMYSVYCFNGFCFQLLYLPHNYSMYGFRDIISYATSPYYSLNNLVCLYFREKKPVKITFLLIQHSSSLFNFRIYSITMHKKFALTVNKSSLMLKV